MNNALKGTIYAILAYVIWGCLPLYWHLLEAVSPVEILFHRLLWSGVILLITAAVLSCKFRHYFKDVKLVFLLFISGLIISSNWGSYIYAINCGHVLEASLGYFINPLMTVAAGVFIFKEHLTRVQLIALILAIGGVSVSVVAYGHLPFLALYLAFSFTLYSIIKKKLNIAPFEGMCLETLSTIPVALIGLMILAAQGVVNFGVLRGDFSPSSLYFSALLIVAGFISMIPLILFNKGASLAPLAYVGFVQYVSPTIVFFLGLFFYHEELSIPSLICFVCIWAGIALMLVEQLILHRARKTQRRV